VVFALPFKTKWFVHQRKTLLRIFQVMNFFLAYQDEKRGELITNRKQIVKAYVFGWFPIDFISVVPFDLANVFGDDDNKSAVADLKILKVIRLLRLIKLLRIMRASRVMKRLENQIGLSFRAISLLKFLTMIIILVHWIACLWNLIPGLQVPSFRPSSLPFFLLSSLPSFPPVLPSFFDIVLPSYSPSFTLSFLHIVFPSFLPSSLPSFI
jgi:hypothetical protein